jgi:hypothetical protein
VTKHSINYDIFVMIDIEGSTDEQIRSAALDKLDLIKSFLKNEGYHIGEIIVEGESFGYNENP